MPGIKRTIVVAAPVDVAWDYVRLMGNWAGLVPGYQAHEELNDQDSVWTLMVNLGPVTRMMELDVHVTERTPPRKVAFAIKGRDEPVSGSGIFTSESQADGKTCITLDLSVDGTGPVAPVIAKMAGPVLSHMAHTFARRLAAQIEQRPVPQPP